MDRHIFLSLFFCILLGGGLTACQPNRAPREVSQIRVLAGADQAALPGEEFTHLLQVEFLGRAPDGWFGKNESAVGVPGVKIQLAPAPDSDLSVEPRETVTDAFGRIAVKVKAGRRIGDNYLLVTPVGFEARARRLRFAVGAKFSGGGQEGLARHVLREPVSVQLRQANGAPIAGAPVYFSVLTGGKQPAKVLRADAVTDAHGIASARILLGAKTGEYRIAVEIADPKKGFFLRQNQVRVLGFNLTTVLMGVIGGLVFFVFGMKMMSGGLRQIAGENMRKFLQLFSKNKLVAIVAGIIVTAVLQSSGATNVMVIGFINAGLLSLQQAIGIIFGANIGTTVTAQIISFNLSSLALPVIAIGFLLMLAKKRVVRGWGESLLGFGMIFFGLTMMSTELKGLSIFPSFVRFFKMIDCAPAPGSLMPFGAIMCAIALGIVGTCLTESSFATIGIVLALAGSGLINFYTAVPILIGTNIGTTITAWIAAMTANRVAKQAALAHLLFNLFGAVLMTILFYVPCGPKRIPVFLWFINAVTPGNVFAAIPQNVARHIAMAHTFFNVVTVAAIYPFMNGFVKLCEYLLPVRTEAGRETIALEPHLLATPSIALEQSVSAIRQMVGISWNMIDTAVNRHFIAVNTDPDLFKELEESEEKIDAMQSDITRYLVRITRRPLTHSQSYLIPLLMHCVNDAERIADHADNILNLTTRLAKAKIVLSDIAFHDLERLWNLLSSQAHNVTLALAGKNQENVALALENERQINNLTEKYEKDYTRKEDYEALDVNPENWADAQRRNEHISEMALEKERQINLLTKKYEENHIKRRNSGKCAVDASVIFIEMLWEMERIGDHLANIAMRAPEIQKHYVAL